MRLFFLAVSSLLSVTCCAADPGNLVACKNDLRELVLQDFKTPADKSTLYAALTEKKNDIYTVQIYHNAGSAKSHAGEDPPHRATFGWIALHTKTYTAVDISGEQPVSVKLDLAKYKNYVDKCIEHDYRRRVGADAVTTTSLPFRLDSLADCYDADEGAAECLQRFHEYPAVWLDPSRRSQLPAALQTIFILPPLGDLTVYLGIGDVEEVLYVFKDGKLLSQQTVGVFHGGTIVTFDINKEYLITTYERAGSIDSKINKVEHAKLLASGKFMACSKANPSCG
jgi:hypothetical protein